MIMQVIGVHYQSKSKDKITGFRIYDDDTQKVGDYAYDAVKSVLIAGKFPIVGLEYDKANDTIVGSNGALDRYSGFVNNKLIRRAVTIVCKYDEEGFRVVDQNGNIKDLNYHDTLSIIGALGNKISNGKLVGKKDSGDLYSVTISAIKGTYRNKPASSVKFESSENKPNKNEGAITVKREATEAEKKVSKEFEKKAVVQRKIHSEVRFQYLSQIPTEQSRMKERDASGEYTVEQKLSAAVFTISYLCPFYYAVYRSIEIFESSAELGCETLGVTPSAMYFNPDTIIQSTLPELIWILIHEMSHIAMGHAARGVGKNHEVFNIAADLYINKRLAEDFGTKNSGVPVPVNYNGKTLYLQMPDWVCYSDNVDTSVDTPESIYEEIYSQLVRDKMRLSDSKQPGSSDSEGVEVDDADSSSGSDNGKSGEGSGSASDNQNGQGSQNNQDSQNGQSNQSQQGNQSGQGSQSGQNSQNGQGSQTSQGRQSGSANGNDRQGTQGGDDGQNANNKDRESSGEVIFRGAKLSPKKEAKDLAFDKKSKEMTKEQLANKVKEIQNKIQTTAKLRNAGVGAGGQWLSDLIASELAPVVDWKKLLRNRIVKSRRTVDSFSSINKRYIHMGKKLPGPKKADPTELENVYVCIDTSGSMSEKEIGDAFNQINKLLKQFKDSSVKLIYWDFSVEAVYDEIDIKTFSRARAAGGGGTDPGCVFKYLEGDKGYKRTRNHTILMFTDGGFGPISDRVKKNFGREIIWVLAEYAYKTELEKNVLPGIIAPLTIPEY